MVTWPRTVPLVAATMLSLLLFTACSEDGAPERDRSEDVPGLITAANEQLSLDPDIDNLRAMLVYVDGEPVLENYYDWPPDSRWDVSSLANTIVSVLVGIALEEGAIPSLSTTLGDLLPDQRADMAPAVLGSTLDELLTMSAGFAGLDRDRTREYMAGPDPLSRILRSAPDPLGGGFDYSNQGAHVLAAVLAHATGMPVLDYAKSRLFDPLGIDTREGSGFVWPQDSAGLHLGWGGLRLRPDDLVRLGQLFLDRGAWQGRRVVPPGWIRQATQEQVPETDQTSFEPTADGFGYGWWLTEADGETAYFAYGLGGQLVEVVPSRSLVVVVASEIEPDKPQTHGLSSVGLTFLVDDVIAPALAP
jgi:CubicO group peptidase (beta-lactamase class C family)